MNNSKGDGGRRSFKECYVKIGLRPLLFIALLDLISRKTVVNDAMKKLLYADDLALVANGKQELQEILAVWKCCTQATRGRAGHLAGGEETDSTGQFHVPRRSRVRRREDGEGGTSKSTGRSERVEGVMADRRI